MDEQVVILGSLALVALVLGIVVRTLMLRRPLPLPESGALRLVVRPLKELSPDPEYLYLGRNFSRDLAAKLQKFERLEPSVNEEAASLYVDGTARKTGPRVGVNVRLVSGRAVMWRGTYDGALTEQAKLQEEIAAHIARTLALNARASGRKG